MIMSLITANTGGSTKRSVVNAVFFIAYCVGNIIGPFAFKSDEAPQYTSGIVAMLAAYVVEIFLLLSFAVYMRRLNSDKDKTLEREGWSLDRSGLQQLGGSVADQTDKEDVHFRYSY
jgi:hypothetical protein